ncbi:MAG: hypothetical protein ACRD2C_25825 [Acidimicrobiales bacterium]
MTDEGREDVRLRWEVVDFRPDPSGWQAIYFHTEPGPGRGWYAVPVVGWLVQKARRYDALTTEDVDDADAEDAAINDRVPSNWDEPKSWRVVAGVLEDICIEPADYSDTLWRLVAPGESFSSTAEQLDGRRARYHHSHQMRRQQQAE